MRILVANFFPAFHPPRSGGEQRYYYLHRYLSSWYDITLLSPTYGTGDYEVVTFSPSFREHRVPKEAVFDQLHWKLGAQGIGPECSAYVVALAAAGETRYGQLFDELAASSDLIIHESPFTLPYDRTLGADGKPRIYNAYNVEYRLAAQILRGDAGRQAVEFIHFLERTLVEASQLVLATCEEERELFVADFAIESDRVVLAPNGFEPSAEATAEAAAQPLLPGDAAPYAIFMGSAHPPNVEAAEFIAHRLAAALPDIEFRVLGSVCGKLTGAMPVNVKTLGYVEEDEKRVQLEQCLAALNPLFSGAGTNLKMLDYMAAGVPIVSTPIGARGLSLRDGVDAFIVPSDQMADKLRELSRDPEHGVAVARRAKQRAFAEFTWEHIAQKVHKAVAAVMTQSGVDAAGQPNRRRQRLLVINDFPVSRATGGGQVRISELLTELGREFDVFFLCMTQEVDRAERVIAPGVLEVAIPKTMQHRKAETESGRDSSISVNDIVAAEFCASNAAFVSTFTHFERHSVAVIFEHPYLAPMLEFASPGALVVYSSLNVERELKAAVLASRGDCARWLARVHSLEAKLLDRADMIVCVSEADRLRFEASHPTKRFVVVENGARCERHSPRSEEIPVEDSVAERAGALAVFIGSAHTPNVEAARFIIEVVAPGVREVQFGLVGSVCDSVATLRLPANVSLLGVLSEDEKNLLLCHATIAVNPMFEGGGSSLKVPDSFAAGLPLVSTEVGVRGYAVADGEHYVAANRIDFAAKVRRLAGDAKLRSRIGRAALAYSNETLDWRVLGSRYRRALRDLVAPDRRPRLLVITYRYMEPPPGGAESFLLNVLRELDRNARLDVEVAACDIESIENQWHFSARYGARDDAQPVPSNALATHRFSIDDPRADAFEQCARLFDVWMQETRAQALEFTDLYDRPLLLGGWNFPESYGGRRVRWSSQASQIHVGTHTGAITIEGYAPAPLQLALVRGTDRVASTQVDGAFTWSQTLSGSGSVVTLVVARCYRAPDDPRQLGVAVHALGLREPPHSTAVDLEVDFEKVVRTADPIRWVRSLIALTSRRDRHLDDLFVSVRGPHSTRMMRWLEDNAASYDALLIQGVPFAILVDALRVAKRHGGGAVLLPHFHMEDRYYHWRSFYDAFRDADCVIAAPSQAKSVFFDGIGAHSVIVPGGGVDMSEYAATDLAQRQRAFRAVHPGDKPFVLVLGRKAGGKNYRMAIDAIAELNASAHRIDLVMVGPDDDKTPVTAPDTYYYGPQPRDVVLGALSLALCLVNMSDSESFGIVVLESWLSGRPVVVQRKCLAFADLVVPEQNGFLVESTSEIAHAIGRYLDDADVAGLHARNGREIATQYSWTRVAADIEEVVSSVIDGAPVAQRKAALATIDAPSLSGVRPADRAELSQ